MAWWVPLAIIAASALAKNKANTDALKQQESIRRAMEAFQMIKAREGEAATEQLLEKQTPKAREDELAQITADRARSMRETVASAAPSAAPVAGALSQDFERSQEAAANSVAERTRRAIQQLSAMGAPGEQQQKFGIRHGRAAGVVDASNMASERVGARYGQDIAGVRPDPFLSMAGDIGMAVGTGMMGGAGAGALAGGSGITAGAGSQGLNPGAGAPGLRVPWQNRLSRGFSLWGA